MCCNAVHLFLRHMSKLHTQRDWERWPFWLRYLPLVPLWCWYCIKARSFWFFTPSNPTLTFGGFEGEPKMEMYEQLPPSSYPNTLWVAPGSDINALLKQLADQKFTYPFIVKPDVGMSGVLFRRIRTEADLRHYHQHMPAAYLVQALVTLPTEYSVFYYRMPDQQKGTITGFLEKEPLSVTGDGKRTLQQLIHHSPAASLRRAELEAWHAPHLQEILPAGEKRFLSDAANLNRGGQFRNLALEIDKALHAVFDDLNLYSKHFYYGRYDLKAASLADLKAGRNYSILEYNGAGAEPNHVYHSNYSWIAALREIAKHWRALYRISKAVHQTGVPYWSFQKGRQHLKASNKHFKILNALDRQTGL